MAIAPAPVYPRWRGEHNNLPVLNKHIPGLSPLARGTHLGKSSLYLLPRFIPAGAGNTLVYPAVKWIQSVYPRWRGEHSSVNTF